MGGEISPLPDEKKETKMKHKFDEQMKKITIIVDSGKIKKLGGNKK
jgi:hypothetical protein